MKELSIELSIEEKAKRYDEAIKVAKSNYETIVQMDNDCTFAKEGIFNTFHHMFPELKESEDEKVRKKLINIVKKLYEQGGYALHKYEADEMLAYLEKQGEMDMESYKTAEDEKREFVGDGFIKCYADFQDFKEGETYWFEYIGNDNYNVRSDNLLGKTYHITPCQLYTIFKKQTWLEKKGEQKYTPKHKIGDTIYYNSFGEVKSMIVANVVTDSTDNPMYEDENGSDVFEKDIIEQKSTDKIEPKFKAGDWIVFNGLTLYVNEVVQGYYRTTSIGGIPNSYDWDIDNAARLWTIQDAKNGDVLTVDNVIFIYERTLAKHIVSYCKLINDIFEPSVDARTCCEGNTYVHPATKEQRNTLEKAMADAGYTFDFEKKELKKIEQKIQPKFEVGDIMRSLEEAKEGITDGLPVVVSIDEEYYLCNNELISIKDQDKYEYPPMNRKQKPAWSKEDDKMLNDILMCGERHCYLDAGNIAWLKSLKDRVTIQPRQEWSEEDEKCIRLSNAIIDSALRAGFCVQLDRDRCVDWLKSLRPQNTWLPSDEQMNAFDAVLVYNSPCSNECRNHLITLYNDLKKLKSQSYEN